MSIDENKRKRGFWEPICSVNQFLSVLVCFTYFAISRLKFSEKHCLSP